MAALEEAAVRPSSAASRCTVAIAIRRRHSRSRRLCARTRTGPIDGFRNQGGLGHIKADVAYGHLELLHGPDTEPGAGVTLGFIDTGIDLDHPMFAGKNVVEEFTPGAVDETGIDDFPHGTVEASIAAGGRLTSASPRLWWPAGWRS